MLHHRTQQHLAHIILLSLFAANLLLFVLPTSIEAHNLPCGTRGEHWNQFGTPTLSNRRSLNTVDNTVAQNTVAEWSFDTILNLFDVTTAAQIEIFNVDLGQFGPGGRNINTKSGCHITHANPVRNSPWTDWYSSAMKQNLYCHEVGHAFGLNHFGAVAECLVLPQKTLYAGFSVRLAAVSQKGDSRCKE